MHQRFGLIIFILYIYLYYLYCIYILTLLCIFILTQGCFLLFISLVLKHLKTIAINKMLASASEVLLQQLVHDHTLECHLYLSYFGQREYIFAISLISLTAFI